MRCCSVGDSPSLLIDKIQEATRIYVDTARKFGLTGTREALVSWGLKGRAQLLSHTVIREDQGALLLRIPEQKQPLRRVSEYKHAGTSVSSAVRDISHKVSVATKDYLQAVKTAFSRRRCPREWRIRDMQALVESKLLSNSGG